jgi:uncharacterized protein
VQAGDLEELRSIYAEDAQIWHNFDQVNQTVDENLRVLTWMHRRVKDLRYEEVRRFEIPGGFLQQHVLRGIAPSGQPLEVPGATICTVKDGRVTRLEAYVDSAHTAVLQA